MQPPLASASQTAGPWPAHPPDLPVFSMHPTPCTGSSNSHASNSTKPARNEQTGSSSNPTYSGHLLHQFSMQRPMLPALLQFACSPCPLSWQPHSNPMAIKAINKAKRKGLALWGIKKGSRRERERWPTCEERREIVESWIGEKGLGLFLLSEKKGIEERRKGLPPLLGNLKVFFMSIGVHHVP